MLVPMPMLGGEAPPSGSVMIRFAQRGRGRLQLQPPDEPPAPHFHRLRHLPGRQRERRLTQHRCDVVVVEREAAACVLRSELSLFVKQAGDPLQAQLTATGAMVGSPAGLS